MKEKNCFVTVPETTLSSGIIVPSFKVGKYACSKGDYGKAIIAASRAPWVRINFNDAKKACEEAGFKLITELQWLAIAYNTSQQDCNWTGGKVGEGELFCGIRLGDVDEAQRGDFVPANESERRWLTLSNGERICDINGNIYQWVHDNVQGDDKGLTTKIDADSISLTTAPFPSLEKSMGWRPDGARNWSGHALIRCGCWYSESGAGVFSLNDVLPGNERDYIGFRCIIGTQQ